MTPQQTAAPTTEPTVVEPVTIDSLSNSEAAIELLDSQTNLDGNARDNDFIAIQDTNLPEISLEDVEPGQLLYDPRTASEVLEVVELYEDDFGNNKVRTKLHTNDHRDGRLHSYFARHVPRDFTFMTPTATDNADVELSVKARTSAWGGETPTDASGERVQTTIGDVGGTPEETASTPSEDDSNEDTKQELEQQTLF